MIPQLLWLCLLAVAAALAWRAIEEGGPIGRWLWWGIGAAGLMVFGGEMLAAVPELLHAVTIEDAWGRTPVVHLHVALLGLAVIFRPHRRLAPTP